MCHADFDHVLILAGVELSHPWSRRRRAACCSSVGGPEIVVSALGHHVVPVNESHSAVTQVLKSLPGHYHAPTAAARLNRIIGILRGCGATVSGRDHVVLVIVPRWNQQAQPNLRVINASFVAPRTSQPALRSDSDIAESGCVQCGVLRFQAATGIKKEA